MRPDCRGPDIQEIQRVAWGILESDCPFPPDIHGIWSTGMLFRDDVGGTWAVECIAGIRKIEHCTSTPYIEPAP